MMNLKKEKSRVQIEQQFMHILVDIIELYPQYTIPQHLCHILRKKNELDEAYHWSEEVFLKKVEDYYDELKSDLGN